MSAASITPLELAVIVAGATVTYRLPSSVLVSIGPADEADVSIQDPSVSRRHVILDMSDPMRIEDLGSANSIRIITPQASTGTTKIIQTHVPVRRNLEVCVGDAIVLGTARLVIQRAQPREDGPVSTRRVRSFTSPVI